MSKTNARVIDTLLLAALPASGKSEVRRFLELQDPDVIARDFHLGETVQLDDYPYVHMMRRISEEMARLGETPLFFQSSDQPFTDPRDWGTLIELVNEDYHDLHTHPRLDPKSCAQWLFHRFDRARQRAGASRILAQLPERVQAHLRDAVESDARDLLEKKRDAIPTELTGRTILIEFARGGAQGAPMPLPEPFGYQYSFARLSDEILRRASVLYIWVTPEESRRKNEERAKPGRDGDASILHHGVPIAVMLGDYGTDDMGYLIGQSDKPDTVRVETRGSVFHLPVARFDNRSDLTTFLRQEPEDWPPDKVAAIRAELQRAVNKLIAASRT